MAEDQLFQRGWLRQELAKAQDEVRAWPEWKRRAYGMRLPDEASPDVQAKRTQEPTTEEK